MNLRPRPSLALLLVALGLAAPLAAAPDPGQAVVFVDAEPLGSRILVDGQLWPAKTPALLRGLTPGRHRLAVGQKGYLTKTQTLEVPAEGTVQVNLTLVPDSAVLAFPGAEGVQGPDGVVPAAGRQFQFAAGSYRLEAHEGSVSVAPVFPEEGELALARWGLGLSAATTVLAVGLDLASIDRGDVSHPRIGTLGLVLASSALLPWWLQLETRHQRFAKAAAPDPASLSGRINEAQPLFTRGEDALLSGDLPGAEALFEQLIREQPTSRLVPGAWFRLARIHSLTGQTDLALGEYRLVAEVYPQVETHDRARAALANLLEADGDASGALAQLEALTYADGFFNPDDVATQKLRLSSQGDSHAP